jgi:hypothetical protein
MLYKRRCSFPENLQFFLDQLFAVIDSLCSVPSDVVPNATHNIVRRTIQHNNSVYHGNGRNVLRLSRVTRNAVKDEHIVFREPDPVQIQGYDLFRQGEVLVFEQETALEDTVNEVEFLFRIGCRSVHAGNSISQLGPEIEMLTPASKYAPLRNHITKGTLADTGGAEKEDCINGEGEKCIRYHKKRGHWAKESQDMRSRQVFSPVAPRVFLSPGKLGTRLSGSFSSDALPR